jgi:hypothetical protein
MKCFQSALRLWLIWITTLLTFFISACSKKNTVYSGREKFGLIIAKLLIAEKMNVPEKSRIALIKNIFLEAEISPDEFCAFCSGQKSDLDLWISAYASAKKQISAMETTTDPHPDSEKTE